MSLLYFLYYVHSAGSLEELGKFQGLALTSRVGHGELPEGIGEVAGSCSEAEFKARIDAMPAEHRDYALGIYANAIASKLGLAEGSDTVAG